jgi:hypothetical protein
LLLCHYSDFFDSCFNGGFVETPTQTLFLPDDRVEDFQILLEFMLRGDSPGSIKFSEVSTRAADFKIPSLLERSFDFIRYADKYNLAEAAEVVYEPLQQALSYQHKDGNPTKMIAKLGKWALRIAPSDVELIFRVMPVGSKGRTLVV